MKKKFVGILTAAALLSVAAAGIGTAYSYFTTYVEAAGKHPVSLGDETTITEEFEDWIKKVCITNKETSAQAVWVRVQAFCGSRYELEYEGEGWEYNAEDEYWYYSDPVVPGGSTLDPTASGTPDEAKYFSVKINDLKAGTDPQSFNVVIVYETTPAVQNGTDEEGKILYEEANWTLPVEGGENS